jgi:DNA-binding transcriptional ArsR family regulator
MWSTTALSSFSIGTVALPHPVWLAMTKGIAVLRQIPLASHISLCLSIDMFENEIFKALADPTRRTIFEKLANGSMNASTLREGMDISQPAMSQHLAVLRNARLVREERQGRFVNYEVDPDGLMLIAGWLTKYRTYWPMRIDALKTLLKDMN